MKTITHPWHAIHAGGLPQTAFVDGAWIVPMFSTHTACGRWWDRYVVRNDESSRPWAITDKMPAMLADEVEP